MDTEILKKALALHGISEEEIIKPLSGGTWSAVYEFRKQNKSFVMRIVEIDYDVDATDSVIEWVQYLEIKNLAVPKMKSLLERNSLTY